MIVSELIEFLKKHNPNAIVEVFHKRDIENDESEAVWREITEIDPVPEDTTEYEKSNVLIYTGEVTMQ